jgi:transcriptional regulator with XRE-family HTH domain
MTFQANNYDKFLFLVNSILGNKDWTRGKIADAVGVARQHFSSVCSGKKVLTDSLLSRTETLAKKVLPPEFFQDQVNITDRLSPKARAILEMIAKVEGVSESEAMNRAIEEFGATWIQGSSQKPVPVPIQKEAQSPEPE